MENKFLKKIMFVLLFFIGGVAFMSSSAQANLEKWAEQCSNTEGVDYSVISKKDKLTKKPISVLISISFKDKPRLMAALESAISKDKKDAIEVMERKKGGVLKPEIYKFYDDVTDQYTNYIFSESNDGTLSVVITSKQTVVVKSKR